jgi:DNA-binding response OmpR family regulator
MTAQSVTGNGRVSLDSQAMQVFVDESEVFLTLTEFRVLEHLINHRGSVVTHEQIIAALWGQWFSTNGNLYVHISNVRRKLADLGAGPNLIVTVRGVGYRFAQA